LLRVEWLPDVIVLRRAGYNQDIQCEELRLVDPEELKALRGGKELAEIQRVMF